jgi:RNA polymerase sigma-70 factor (ECF subfamily)
MSSMTLEASSPALSSAARSTRDEDLDDELVRRLCDGEIEAVGEAYDAHHEAVRRFAQRLLGEEAAAEDLVQEVFLALPRLAGRFRGDSSLRTFLISVAANHCRHYVRASSRRRANLKRANDEVHAPGMGSGSADPEHDLGRRQLAELLSQALDRLSLDHRLTFVLCEVEHRTSREVAVILGVPEGTVRTRLLHAKKNLRQWLSQKGLA